VVLSACEVAASEIEEQTDSAIHLRPLYAERHVGLDFPSVARLFGLAKCCSMITTLWRVADKRSLAEFMVTFYRKLLLVKDVYMALSQAQKDMIKKTRGSLAVAAAFVPYGKP
jgi:CHAT domain-containing protein